MEIKDFLLRQDDVETFEVDSVKYTKDMIGDDDDSPPSSIKPKKKKTKAKKQSKEKQAL